MVAYLYCFTNGEVSKLLKGIIIYFQLNVKVYLEPFILVLDAVRTFFFIMSPLRRSTPSFCPGVTTVLIEKVRGNANFGLSQE